MECGAGGAVGCWEIRKARLLAGVGIGALAVACALPSPAAAETYYVSDAGQLRDTIILANGDGDPNSTIVMTNDFGVDGIGLPGATKPLTIDTNGFTLSTAGNNGINFQSGGGGITLEGTITGADIAANSTSAVVSIRGISSLVNNGTIQGGASSAGTGAAGIDLSGPPAGPATLVNHGIIRGGDGTTVGGIGVFVRAGANPVINTGTIEGGNGALALTTTGATTNLRLVNSGTIRAGTGQANAISLAIGSTAAINLELQAGSQIFGNVIGHATAANDVLRLGGDEDDTFDASAIGTQYQNFNIFEKTGNSIWTLTGTTTALTPWQLLGGTLAVSSDGALGDVAGALTFDGGTLRALASFETSRTMDFVSSGGIDVDAGAMLTVNGALSGSGGLVKRGEGTLLQNSVAGYIGGTGVLEGTLQAGLAGVFAGEYVTSGDGTLDLAGFDQTLASLDNAGAVRLGGAPGTTLTVTGNYVGSGGVVELNAALGDDSSVTDLLWVQGSTSGNSSLIVNNIGGAGAQTVDGIKIIDVGGASDGTFSLLGDYIFQGDQAVVGGAFAYRLYQGTPTDADGDWYLRSQLIDVGPLYQAGVPVYEAYPGVLQSFNQLGTLQQRLGNRSWTVVAQGADTISEEAAVSPGIGIWGQIEGGYGEFDPETSTTETNYDVAVWRMKAGVDTVLSESASGQLIGGVSLHYGTASSDISSIFGDGSIDATGYGAGGSPTWYGNTGFYADAQAQVTGYDSDLHSDTAGVGLVEGNDGLGYALGIELGQRIPIAPEWALTPQAQLAWSSVEFDDFTDAFGAEVSLDSGDSLIGRLGLAVDRQTEWLEADGTTSRTHLYGIGNLYYDFEDGTSVDVAGTPVDSEVDALWGGLGLGGTYAWMDDRYALYGEASAKSQLEDFGDSYAIGGTVGFKMTW